jgi:hypothetical protein
MPAPGPRIGWRSETNPASVEPTEADIGDNLQKHFAFIDEAREKGVDLLVSPELSRGTSSSCASGRGTRCG